MNIDDNAKKIADDADMIVNGYAFTKKDDVIRVININNLKSTCVIDSHDEIIETTMSDIEMEIVLDYYRLDKNFLESKIA